MRELLTTRQVAEELGVHITTIYGYIHQGNLRAHKIGGYTKQRHWRIKRKDLIAFTNNSGEAGTRETQ